MFEQRSKLNRRGDMNYEFKRSKQKKVKRYEQRSKLNETVCGALTALPSLLNPSSRYGLLAPLTADANRPWPLPVGLQNTFYGHPSTSLTWKQAKQEFWTWEMSTFFGKLPTGADLIR